MRRSTTKTYTTRAYLITTPEIETFLDDMLWICAQIYNQMLCAGRKIINRLLNEREYHDLRYRKKRTKEDNARMKEIETAAGYGEFLFHKKVQEADDFHGYIIGSWVCQKPATRAFNAVERYKTGKAKKLKEKTKNSNFYAENKGNTGGMYLTWMNGRLYAFWNGKGAEVEIDKNDEFFQKSLLDSVKYVGIGREWIRGRKRYYVIITHEGVTPNACSYGGPLNRVGIDIGPSTIAVVAPGLVRIYSLNPEKGKYDDEIARLQQEMDSERRRMNSDNYDDKGCIKPKKERKPWVNSPEYERLLKKLRKLKRNQRIERDEYQNKIMNEILSYGTIIIVEKMNFRALQRRAKKTTINEKTGLPNSKGRYGKSIGYGAPAAFLKRLDLKLKAIGSQLYEVATAKVKASQFNHKTGEYEKNEKNPLSRWKKIGRDTVQRDLYSAFLLMNVNSSLDRVNRASCNRTYREFLELMNKEIERVRALGPDYPLAWYVK